MKNSNLISLDFMANICHEITMKVRELNNETDFETKFENLDDESKNVLYAVIEDIIKGKIITAKDIHNEWQKQKFKNGWTYNISTNREKKQHNCLVPFQNLSFLQQLKDHLLVETVKFYLEYDEKNK